MVLMLTAPGVEARTRSGEKLLKKAREAEARQSFDEAAELYEQALATDPRDAAYTMGVKRARFQASQKHVDAGQRLRAEGNLEGALVEFQKAIARDPSSAIALQDWKRTSEMLEKNASKPAAERGLTPSERARKDTDERAASMMSPPELQPIIRIIPPLKMNNQPPKVLYETVSKLAGINVIFDQSYQPPAKNLNVEFSNATIEQALDYLAVLTKTFWKPISTNTIFVTEDNVTKRRDYEDNVVKVFYVQNATSVQEFQEIATAVRSLTEIRRVFTYNAQKAILMRGTPDQIALAEKLIHDLDKPKAEVVVDVIVMEANSSKTRDLAAAIISAGKAGLNLPVSFTPRSTIASSITQPTTTGGGTTNTPATPTTASTALTLGNLSRVDGRDFSTTVPGALLNLVVNDSQTRVLQSPQVRASDGQKVTLRIGDKVPYATGSFQPGVGTVGVSPLVSTQFNFAEVGVNVDITPQVHGAEEVTLKLAVEVSTVSSHVTIGGVDQPVVSQRKNETEIRMREGEVNILSGLTQDQDTKSTSGVPGLVNIPILGRLLGSEHTDKSRGQLLIAIIPHIVRTPNYSDADLKAVASGTDQTFKVSYAARAQAAGAPAGQPPAGTPATAAPDAPKPVDAPKPSDSPKPTLPGMPEPGGAKITFLPPVVTAAQGTTITLTLQAENITDLFSAAPVRIKFDNSKLRLNDIVQGELLGREEQRVTVTRDIRNDSGEASVTLSRLPGAPGVNGSGALATFTFSALGKGPTQVTVTELGIKNTQQQPIVIPAPQVQVTVQ